VQHGRIRRDAIIHPQVKIRHPNRTGLAFQDGTWVYKSDPFHLKEMEVFFADDRVCWFTLTSALSDDPLISFALRARTEAPLRVVLVNTAGERFEATHQIRFS
jgi:hypothetical protein